MDRFVYCASIVLVLGLLHYSYLDWRARAHGGVMWFWTAWDKPVLLRVSNVAALGAFALALASFALGVTQTLVMIVAALFVVHVVTTEFLCFMILPAMRWDAPTEVEQPYLPARDEKSPDTRGLDLSERFWKNEIEGLWLTDFPPPSGFDGYQSGNWGSPKYERACTPDEIAILEAKHAAGISAERAEDEALRDAWLEVLRKDLPSVSEPSAMQPQADAEGEPNVSRWPRLST
jgi:hypothetical protein